MSYRRAKGEYGKRGGTSKNAGKTASVYLVKLPDGRELRKRSFDVHDDTGYLLAYVHNGQWFTGGIHPEREIGVTELGRLYWPPQPAYFVIPVRRYDPNAHHYEKRLKTKRAAETIR